MLSGWRRLPVLSQLKRETVGCVREGFQSEDGGATIEYSARSPHSRSSRAATYKDRAALYVPHERTARNLTKVNMSNTTDLIGSAHAEAEYRSRVARRSTLAIVSPR